LVAQAFQPVRGFFHSLERLCHQSEELVGNDKPPAGGRGDKRKELLANAISDAAGGKTTVDRQGQEVYEDFTFCGVS
jgi:hypothetical protein